MQNAKNSIWICVLYLKIVVDIYVGKMTNSYLKI